MARNYKDKLVYKYFTEDELKCSHCGNLVIDDEQVIPRLREMLGKAHFQIFALTQSRPSLDDVYLQATGRTLMDAELAVSGQRDIKLESKKAMR